MPVLTKTDEKCKTCQGFVDLTSEGERRCECTTKKYVWVYTVNAEGKVSHERSLPENCKREAHQRVTELIQRGVSAFCSNTFIKDAYY